MQQPPSFGKKMLPLFFLFVIVNSIVLWYQKDLDARKIDAMVVFASNCLLFILSVLSLAMHTRTVDKKNPNAAIRGILAATLLKLMVLGAAALAYLFFAGTSRSVYAVFVGMFLYIIYTFLEVRIASKPNQK
jgi:uncharacterized membrane protein